MFRGDGAGSTGEAMATGAARTVTALLLLERFTQRNGWTVSSFRTRLDALAFAVDPDTHLVLLFDWSVAYFGVVLLGIVVELASLLQTSGWVRRFDSWADSTFFQLELYLVSHFPCLFRNTSSASLWNYFHVGNWVAKVVGFLLATAGSNPPPIESNCIEFNRIRIWEFILKSVLKKQVDGCCSK